MLYKGDNLYLDWLDDGIAELVFDAPGSVNKLDTATVASLGEAMEVLEKQHDLKGLLLRSASRPIAWLTIATGLSTLLDAIGNLLGLHLIAEIGLNLYLVLAIIWPIAIGIRLMRGTPDVRHTNEAAQ